MHRMITKTMTVETVTLTKDAVRVEVDMPETKTPDSLMKLDWSYAVLYFPLDAAEFSAPLRPGQKFSIAISEVPEVPDAT